MFQVQQLHFRKIFIAPFEEDLTYIDKLDHLNHSVTSPTALTTMGDVAVESPLNVVLPHKRQIPSNIPNIDIEGIGNDDSDEYSTLKRLQRHLE
jgi:hypothetical protein